MHPLKLLYIFLIFGFVAHSQSIEQINFIGNKKTKSSVLNKIIRLKVNTPIDSIVIKNDAVLLSRLASISKVSYEVKKELNKNYTVTYTVEETRTLIPSINFWTTVNQQFAYQIGLSEFNFLGENKQVSSFYRNNGLHSWFLHYKDPILFKNQMGISLTLQQLASFEPLYFGDNNAEYEYTNTSLEANIFKKFTYKDQLSFAVNLFNEDYTYVRGFTSDDIPQKLNQNKLLFKINYEINQLNYEYQYVDGFQNSLFVQYLPAIDEKQEPFKIFWNDLLFFKRIKSEGNFATRVRIGFSSNNESPFAPFALDNNLNIRGVGNIIDRGTGVVVLNTEYRHTLLEQKNFVLQGNVFVDAGNWRSAGGDYNELLKKDNARLHPGIGLRCIHKKIYNAILRLDYGFSVLPGKKEKGFVFGIGQYF